MENSNLEKRSVLDIIKALEEKTLNPKELSKDTVKECVSVMKSREYSGLEMGQILQMTPRNVCRYLKKIREENSLVMNTDSQREFFGEMINNFRTQYSRLIRISYLDDITSYERIRAICAACQIQKEVVEIMERFGFFSKEKLEDPDEHLSEAELFVKYNPIATCAKKLLREQREEVLRVIRDPSGYDESKVIALIKRFVAENKKSKLYNRDGSLKPTESSG